MSDSTERDLAGFQPPELVRLRVGGFRLEETLQSGQTFHWHRSGAGWVGLIGRTPVYLEQRTDGLYVPPESAGLIRHYLALDQSGKSLRDSIPHLSSDPALRRALRYAGGLRIMRQPDWECTASFIMSSMKQVSQIRVLSLALRREWGEEIEWNGAVLRAFPTPERLASAGEAGLRRVGLGYRAPLLAGAADMVMRESRWWNALRELPDVELDRSLRTLPGVGPKIARCAMLFGFQRPSAFPVDTWVVKILRAFYFPDQRLSVDAVDAWAGEYFGPNAGWAQQVLFHWARAGKGLNAEKAR